MLRMYRFPVEKPNDGTEPLAAIIELFSDKAGDQEGTVSFAASRRWIVLCLLAVCGSSQPRCTE